MNVYEIKLAYIWSDADGTKKAERIAKLVKFDFAVDTLTDHQINGSEFIIVTAEQAMTFLAENMDEVREVRKSRVQGASMNEFVSRMEGLMSRMEKLATDPGVEQEVYYNNKVGAMAPGSMMSLVNELSIIEDSCTDQIQTWLNTGWRILAICPQPDQRRPDYVLGRYNPDFRGISKHNRPESARRTYDTDVKRNVTPLPDLEEVFQTFPHHTTKP